MTFFSCGAVEVIALRDAGVIQRGEGAGFAFETGEAYGVMREGVGEDFDGDVALELGVVGFVDDAHAAFTDGAGDGVGAEFRAGGEGMRLPTILRGGLCNWFVMIQEDGDIDRAKSVAYWQRLGPNAIFSAAWEMVEAEWRKTGRDTSELEFQKTVELFERRQN